ncbi:uncharacterized protein LOC125370264 [Ricinus communis]|uniref:uncharacterized protein LOC125370264 n=1 Tax=Ricinus communis TaxID=3988 RepID=UPI00201AE871|nr:uncharacterized protein LOC125370264 [Ricinus communis]
MVIFQDMIEESMEVFMDDFLVFGNSFSHCLSNLERMLARCVEPNLVLNWEKCHFMVTEGIVLGHKLSHARMEVDRAKVETISKLAPPSSIQADFELLKKLLNTAPIMVSPDWGLPFELICDVSDYAVGAVLGQRVEKKFQPIYYASKTLTDDQEHYTTTENELLVVEFKIEIKDKKGIENLAVDHLSRLENPSLAALDERAIDDSFHMSICIKRFDDVYMGRKLSKSLSIAMRDQLEAIRRPIIRLRRCWMQDSTGLQSFKMREPLSRFVMHASGQYILVVVEYFSKWPEVQAFPTNDAKVVARFLKKLFARFGTPKALINDKGTHFCNTQLGKVLKCYGVTHWFSTPYHPQISGQVKVTNRDLKRILERTVGTSRKDWAAKLDDALWAFRTAYRTSISFTPYRPVYGKTCHLPVELEHRALWALKSCNFSVDSTMAAG